MRKKRRKKRNSNMRLKLICLLLILRLLCVDQAVKRFVSRQIFYKRFIAGLCEDGAKYRITKLFEKKQQPYYHIVFPH